MFKNRIIPITFFYYDKKRLNIDECTDIIENLNEKGSKNYTISHLRKDTIKVGYLFEKVIAYPTFKIEQEEINPTYSNITVNRGFEIIIDSSGFLFLAGSFFQIGSEIDSFLENLSLNLNLQLNKIKYSPRLIKALLNQSEEITSLEFYKKIEDQDSPNMRVQEIRKIWGKNLKNMNFPENLNMKSFLGKIKLTQLNYTYRFLTREVRLLLYNKRISPISTMDINSFVDIFIGILGE